MSKQDIDTCVYKSYTHPEEDYVRSLFPERDVSVVLFPDFRVYVRGLTGAERDSAERMLMAKFGNAYNVQPAWDLHSIEELVRELVPDASSITASREADKRVRIDVRGLTSEQRLQLALGIGHRTGLVAYVEEKEY